MLECTEIVIKTPSLELNNKIVVKRKLTFMCALLSCRISTFLELRFVYLRRLFGENGIRMHKVCTKALMNKSASRKGSFYTSGGNKRHIFVSVPKSRIREFAAISAGAVQFAANTTQDNTKCMHSPPSRSLFCTHLI